MAKKILDPETGLIRIILTEEEKEAQKLREKVSKLEDDVKELRKIIYQLIDRGDTNG